MAVLRFLRDLFGVLVAALLGNWVGDQLRAAAAGEAARELRFTHTTEEGETVLAVNVVMTNWLPAVLLGMVARPRWLGAFAAGVVSSAIMGEQYEEPFWELVGQIRQRIGAEGCCDDA